MRVVLDTNVVVSALVWGGTPDRLIQAAIDDQIDLVSPPALLNELREVLARRHLATRLTQNQSTVAQAIALYERLTLQVTPLETPRVVAADVDDDHVLACALTADADLIVSGDKRHLLPLGNYQHILIVTAAEAVNRIEAAKN
jgi:putative PIN family toxin of toxin-antitoxin system